MKKSILLPLAFSLAVIISYLPATARAALSVTNGSFTNLTGLSGPDFGVWYGGVPAGWTTTSGATNGFNVLNSSGTYYANLSSLGPTSPSFAPLNQNIGTVDVTSDVSLTFTLTALQAGAGMASAIYGPEPLAVYVSGVISSTGTVTYTAKGVAPGSAINIAFWNDGPAAGLTGVSISDTATTYVWNGGVSGVWTNGGGGWLDKFDNTATNYNNAKPVVAQFTNAAAGTNVTVASDGVNVGRIDVAGGDYTFSGGTITMTNTAWSVSSAVALVSNTLAGATGLTKSGSGTLVLSASNSYSGGTTLSNGTLALSNANALGSGKLTVNGGTLDLGGNDLTAASLGGTGGTIALGTNTLTASMSTAGVFLGVISGSGGLVKTGADYLTLMGSNTYSGGTVVSSGTLFVTGSGTLGDAAGTVTVSNAVLDLRNEQTRTGTITMIGQDARIFSGDPLNPGSIVNNGGALEFGGGWISAPISGTGGLNVTGGGLLSASNSYTGATVISGTAGWYGTDTFFLQSAHALGAASGDLTISGGRVRLESNTISRSGNVTISGGIVEVGTLSKSGTDYDIQGGTITAVLAGSAGLTKSGAGTATLSASNSFTGAVAVNAGVLNLNSSAGSSLGSASSVSVTNATLLISASDQVNSSAAVTLSGGTIARTSGVSEVMGNLTLAATSTLDYGTGTAGNLEFGTYSPTSGVLLTLNNFGVGNTLRFSSDLGSFISSSTGTSFTNAYFSISGMTAGGFTASFSSGTFTITSVPEPSTLLAIVGLLGVLLWPASLRMLGFSGAHRSARR